MELRDSAGWDHGDTRPHPTWLRGDKQGPVVQRADDLPAATQRICQADLPPDNQIITAPPEHGVLLLVQDNDDVPRLQARHLITLFMEGDLLPILHTYRENSTAQIPAQELYQGSPS